MNYTVQLHGERLVYPVPSGLYELMSDVAREVLRDQPSMLYQYIAHYMETLVRVREYSREAAQLVSDVTQENLELLSYVDKLGVPYPQADQAARRIQRAFRGYRAKHTVRMSFQDRLRQRSITESLREWLRVRELDQETADKASEVIQKAFRTYRSKKVLKDNKVTKDASTFTIESVLHKLPANRLSLSRKKKPPKRDSKLLVYQQSPRDSVLSTWSTLARDMVEKEKHPPAEARGLVKSGTSRTSAKKEVSVSLTSERMESLPSYYDETQPKIPMISESGLLVSDEAPEIVTLFSTDSVEEGRTATSGSVARLPSLLNLAPTTKPEDLAKELFDIIDKKTSSPSEIPILKSLSEYSNDELAKTGPEPSALAKQSSSVSVRKTISTDKDSKKNVSIRGGSES